MRFGIGATSGSRPKLLRMRLLPVNDFVIAFMPVSCPHRPAVRAGRRYTCVPPPGMRRRASHRAQERQHGRQPLPRGPRPCRSILIVRPREPSPAAGEALLLDLDSRPILLEDLADLLRLVLVDAFLDRLRSALDQVLGLLQAEAGDGADLLDDVDLLVARLGEDDGELRLRLDRARPGRRRQAPRRPLPERRRRRPTSPPAAWKGQQPPRRSGRTVRPPASRDRPCACAP